MRRAEALQALSRDHHRALELALKLRRATGEDAAAVRREFLEYWREHGALHFRVEEDVLLPTAAHRVDPSDPAVVRVLTDHIEIRRRASDLEGAEDPVPGELNTLGEALSDHVRHEERVLFPMIEAALSEEELERPALRLISGYEPPAPPAVEIEPRASVGTGWSEAPRGMLWHRYRLEPDGSIAEARIVSPTSQNQARIEQDLLEFVRPRVELPDERLQWECEQAIRNYDPCISCSTHFLKLDVDRG
jgi:hemerythrin-like domain-containing protein